MPEVDQIDEQEVIEDSAPVEAEETLQADAPAEEAEQPEPVRFSEEQQKVFDDAINKKTAKTHKIERESQQKIADMQRELDEVRAKVPQQVRPEIPPAPNPYEDGYEQRIAERDQVILQAAQFDADKQGQQHEEQRIIQRQQQEQTDAANKIAEDYAGRSKKLGITPDDLKSAGATVGNYGLSMDVAAHILREDHGPSITVYLAKNPQVLDEISRLQPMDAAVRISTDIKAAAQAASVKSPQPPEPTEILRGTGMPASRGGPKGATFV